MNHEVFCRWWRDRPLVHYPVDAGLIYLSHKLYRPMKQFRSVGYDVTRLEIPPSYDLNVRNPTRDNILWTFHHVLIEDRCQDADISSMQTQDKSHSNVIST